MSETIWDESYPPSIYGPSIITSAVAGTPGYWTPKGAQAPASLAEANALGLDLGPLPWVTGQYVELSTGAPTHWDGVLFAAGIQTFAELQHDAELEHKGKRARRKAEEE